ncbi:MAG: response regulator [Bacteroidales bacterium]|nr:response regulator [Bacteroidales bacterium]
MNSRCFRYTVYGILMLVFAMQLGLPETILAQSSAVTLTPSGKTFSDRLYFQSLPPNLEYNYIRCIMRDHKGYMWFGSQDGLIRYDGVKVYVYEHNPNDPQSISHNAINAIVEDAEGNLWIGTSFGLNLYNREEDEFIRIGTDDEQTQRLSMNYIRDLAVDHQGMLWIGTFGDGVNILNTRTRSLRHIESREIDPDHENILRITDIVVDQENNIWLGSLEGLYFYQDSLKTFTSYTHQPDDPLSLSSNLINRLVIDFENRLWVATLGSGLNLLIRQNGGVSFKRYQQDTKPGSLSNNYILSLCADPAGYLWVGTENGGLNRLCMDTDQFEVFQLEEGNPFSLSSNSIWSVYHDNEDRIWIGTANKGVNVLDENFSKFQSFRKNIFNKNSLPDNDVKAFATDSNGRLWIATDGGGICLFNPTSNKVERIIKNDGASSPLTKNEIQTIFCDHRDYLWLGTWAGGVDLLDKNGKRIKNYTLSQEPGNTSNSGLTIYSDPSGNLWVGTAGSGLFRYDPEKDEFQQILSEPAESMLNSTSYITSMLSDSRGRFWVGTLNGLIIISSIEKNKAELIEMLSPNQTENLNNRMIETIVEDSRGRLWIGTSNSGLFLYSDSDNSFRLYNKSDGLPGNSVKAILEDKKGNLWISTNQGLCQFNPDSLKFTNYTREDGLNSNEFYQKSCIVLQDDRFFFGSEEGFNAFNPLKIKRNRHIPPVYFSSLKINNAEMQVGAKNSPLTSQISETSKIVLNHKQSSFTIEFVALNYTRSARNHFSYKLEGFDTKWTNSGTGRSANYTNIPPGKYVFLVKGSNNDGVWNPVPAKLYIEINPPMWKTWWAISLYILVISAIVVISLFMWNGRIKMKHQLKLEQLARERERELNENNIEFFTNISHEFRTPLSLIIGPLESLILSTSSRVKEQLTVIYRNAQRLLHLTNDLMDFRKLEEGLTKLTIKSGDALSFLRDVSSYFNNNSRRRKIRFKIETQETDIPGWFDPGKLETIVLNLLSNAFKHTLEGGKVILKIEVLESKDIPGRFPKAVPERLKSNSRYLSVAVIDNGTGIMEEDLPLIFNKFYQADKFTRKNFAGTGIGLPLTKGLIELHYGQIRAESTPGLKTEFSFFIPIDETAYTDQELVREPADIVGKSASFNPELVDPQQETATATNPEQEQGQEKASIMIVEDNHELRNFLTTELSRAFSVTVVSDGKEGLEKVIELLPDLVVSDIVMPQMSGTELCRSIKSDVRTCHIPVILLTAKTTINDQIEGVSLGADAYITKPFNIQFLFTTINQLIQTRRKLYAHFSQDVYMMPNKLTDNELDKEFLQRVIDFIHQNISDNKLSVETLAAEMNLSRSNIYRKIKALTGKTIIEFIRIVKLKHALTLMESKKHSLSEIAYLCGFTSPSYFTKSFRDQYGKPPSDYLS